MKYEQNEFVAAQPDQYWDTARSTYLPKWKETKLNLGSGKDYRHGWLNVDIDKRWNPDLVHDLSLYIHPSMNRDSFEWIVANDVLEHVRDLGPLMTNLLWLLKDGGRLEASVPYDLSYGAWQDPTHVRAFNERSWLYYTDWFWYMGWREFRFDLTSIQFLYSEMGNRLLSGGHTAEQVRTTPRMVDQMNVTLVRRQTTDAEKAEYDQRTRRVA